MHMKGPAINQNYNQEVETYFLHKRRHIFNVDDEQTLSRRVTRAEWKGTRKGLMRCEMIRNGEKRNKIDVVE